MIGLVSLEIHPRITATLLGGAAFTYIILKRPELALIAVIICSSSVFYFEALQVPIGGGYKIAIQEAIIALMFALFILKMILSGDITLVKSPINLPMLAFLSIVIFSSLRSIFQFHISPSLVFWGARSLLQYSLFFLVPYAVRSTKEVKILIWSFFVIAVVVSVMMVMQFLIGSDTRLFIGPEAIVRVVPLDTELGARIIPPGESLIFVMLLVALSLFGTTSLLNSNRIYVFLALLLGVGLLLTFIRSEWVSAIVGFAIIFRFTKSGARRKLIFFIFIGVMALFLFGAFIHTYSLYTTDKGMNFLNLLGERFFSIFGTEVYKADSSFGTRTYELTEAMPYIKAHPLLGIGFHNPYRLRWSVDGYYEYHFVHNGYLFLLLKMGLLGLLSYVWLSVAFLKRAMFLFHNTNELFLKGVVLGSFASYLGVLITNISMPSLWHYRMVPCIALMMGLNEAIWNMERSSDEQYSETST